MKDNEPQNHDRRNDTHHTRRKEGTQNDNERQQTAANKDNGSVVDEIDEITGDGPRGSSCLPAS